MANTKALLRPLAGRQEEARILREALQTNRSELIAVYGRRRIGKTFLIRSVYQAEICFELSGSLEAPMDVQLGHFTKQLGAFMDTPVKPGIPANWSEAFDMLAAYLGSLKTKGKKVVFLDELPWLDTMHSGFLSAFDYFWNNWCTKRNDLVVVLCGSAASWMIEKIVYNKGGLHNRITQHIRLLPFTLSETKEFFSLRNITLDPYQMAQIYMVMGGVPHYLEAIKRGKSATQNIDSICFADQGLLRYEFEHLYQSLYQNAEIHLAIIRALATKRKGLLRSEIIQYAKLKSGGYFSQVLVELEESGFIASYSPPNRKIKDNIYRLQDEYSLFYLKFIESTKSHTPGIWATLSGSPSWRAWSGYAFEALCLKHIQKMKEALQIGGMHSEQYAWYGKDESAQIDLLIHRADRCINLCEMKFSATPYEITASYARELVHKEQAYRSATKTNQTIFTTFVTMYGLKPNKWSEQYAAQEVVVADLF